MGGGRKGRVRKTTLLQEITYNWRASEDVSIKSHMRMYNAEFLTPEDSKH